MLKIQYVLPFPLVEAAQSPPPENPPVCQVRCFNVELVAQAEQALPGDELLEEA